MALPNQISHASNKVQRMGWARLVHDGDTPVDSPAIALQHYLSSAGSDLEHYERYPLAFRIGFPILASAALWFLIISVI